MDFSLKVYQSYGVPCKAEGNEGLEEKEGATVMRICKKGRSRQRLKVKVLH